MIAPPQAKPTKRQTYRERVLAGAVERKPRQRIKPLSANRGRQLAEYSSRRKLFLVLNPKCLVCQGVATEIHHSRGRQGKRLLDTTFFRQLCSECHRRVHDNPTWAKANGLLYLINDSNAKGDSQSPEK